jgi:hypothetical protein
LRFTAFGEGPSFGLQALDKRAATVSEPLMKAEIARAIEDTRKVLEAGVGR